MVGRYWAWLWADPKRSRWFVVAVCFVLGMLVGWLIGKSWMAGDSVPNFRS